MNESAEAAAGAIAQLQVAYNIIHTDGIPGGDLTDILRRLSLMITALDRSNRDAVCRRCGTRLAFTRDEHEFYATSGLTRPRHCVDCRRQRRAERQRRACPMQNAHAA